MNVASITSASAPRHVGAWVLQGVVATAFFAAGAAKLATGIVEVAGALALIVPGLVWFGGLWLGSTMFFAVLFVLHTSPAPAIVLGVLNAVIVYLRRDELVSFARTVAKAL